MGICDNCICISCLYFGHEKCKYVCKLCDEVKTSCKNFETAKNIKEKMAKKGQRT